MLKQIPTSIWDNEDFKCLSPQEQMIVLHAITCPESEADLYVLFCGKISYRLGLDNKRIKEAFAFLATLFPNSFRSVEGSFEVVEINAANLLKAISV